MPVGHPLDGRTGGATLAAARGRPRVVATLRNLVRSLLAALTAGAVVLVAAPASSADTNEGGTLAVDARVCVHLGAYDTVGDHDTEATDEVRVRLCPPSSA